MGRRSPATALSLLRSRRISWEDAVRLYHADSEEAISEVAETLYKSGRVTDLERAELISAIVRDKQTQSKASMKAKMREIDRYMGGGKGSPVAQGGLPSLGKRRP